MTTYDVLIVGAGHGGAQAAVALRQHGFQGTVGMFGDEPEPPYERPPLSKEYMSGERPFDRMLLRPPAFWSNKGVDVVTGAPVTRVRKDEKVAETAEGRRISYGTLIWAAGGAARRLECEGHDLRGVHTVRSRADVDRLIEELPATERVVVVGGGFIGLEAAAVLTKLGKRVTVLEAQDRLLARVCGQEISRFYLRQHRARGVNVHLDTVVESIVGEGGRVIGVRLASGRTISCEMVIVGIGIVPAVAPLVAAGASEHNGVQVDQHCRTSIANVYALGDCARRPSRYAVGGSVRLESVQNAGVMAAAAVASLMGEALPNEPVPWFWSNQFDLRLQTIGLAAGHDRTIVYGDPKLPGFSVIYLREDRILALDCVNAAKQFARGKRLIGEVMTTDTTL
ncbi:FAD-dependent oxidoreductase [uncultured Sphingomonas sp.]|uniref:NAD(P)/FAD-dependent oxidoreductase n=1 Tax=uncultured Sphingomonas sp. TaxID=158754 RepID=UPI0025E7C8FE|nr:FAD-dependent oxidoreductase [uncultured Sphingomonas sp.]